MIFEESRQDWRCTTGPGGLREHVETRASGVRFEPRREGTAATWAAGPTPEGLARWEAAGESPLATLHRIADPVRSESWRLHAAAFRQTVRIGLPGDRVRIDVREGAWVRVEVVEREGNREGVGIAEAVLGEDQRAAVLGAFASAADRALVLAHAVPVDPAVSRVVFAPGVGGLLIHEVIGHALEGDVLARGRSWLAGGRRDAGPAEMVVRDDPGRGRGPWRIDDEGADARQVVLVESGRVTGSLLGGHGRRASYRDPVLPRMGATYLDAGDAEDGDGVADTMRGVYILRMTGGRSDPSTGRAVFRVTDAEAIDQGRRTHPVQPFVMVVPALETPLPIDRIGKEVVMDACIGTCHRAGQPLVTSVGAPTFRLGSVRVIPSGTHGV